MNRPAPGSTFDSPWLRLRQTADCAARANDLTRHAGAWLARRRHPERALSLVDLGSGNGANPYYLAPRLPGPQRWRLIDHDSHLLGQATIGLHHVCDTDGHPVELIGDSRDLVTLDGALLAGSDLVCASALFDLVSRDWLERLADACAAADAAVLFTLSVNGAWHFIDYHGQPRDDDEDRWVRGLVAAHQRRDKGFGAALGGDAPRALGEAFAQRGYRTVSAPSPWRLAPGEARSVALGLALLDGWAQAASEQAPEAQGRLMAWRVARREALDAGQLGLWVGHDDIFAQPGGEA